MRRVYSGPSHGMHGVPPVRYSHGMSGGKLWRHSSAVAPQAVLYGALLPGVCNTPAGVAEAVTVLLAAFAVPSA